jgi:hypothetical protein
MGTKKKVLVKKKATAKTPKVKKLPRKKKAGGPTSRKKSPASSDAKPEQQPTAVVPEIVRFNTVDEAVEHSAAISDKGLSALVVYVSDPTADISDEMKSAISTVVSNQAHKSRLFMTGYASRMLARLLSVGGALDSIEDLISSNIDSQAARIKEDPNMIQQIDIGELSHVHRQLRYREDSIFKFLEKVMTAWTPVEFDPEKEQERAEGVEGIMRRRGLLATQVPDSPSKRQDMANLIRRIRDTIDESKKASGGK